MISLPWSTVELCVCGDSWFRCNAQSCAISNTSMPLAAADVLACSFPAWYSAFRTHTFARYSSVAYHPLVTTCSRIIKLSAEDIQYLLHDGTLVVPTSYVASMTVSLLHIM